MWCTNSLVNKVTNHNTWNRCVIQFYNVVETNLVSESTNESTTFNISPPGPVITHSRTKNESLKYKMSYRWKANFIILRIISWGWGYRNWSWESRHLKFNNHSIIHISWIIFKKMFDFILINQSIYVSSTTMPSRLTQSSNINIRHCRGNNSSYDKKMI